MPFQVILELPDDVRESALASAEQLGIPIASVLIQWLKLMAMTQSTADVELKSEYVIETPYGNEAAAAMLQNILGTAPPL